MNGSYTFSYQAFETAAALNSEDAALVAAARAAASGAYAPYSGFRVGAALRMDNGLLVQGANQENASYPAGICAERAALAVASSLYPGMGIQALAIAYYNERKPGGQGPVLSPCGICRQSLMEYRIRQQKAIRLLMGSPQGHGILVEDIKDLLPFAFTSDHLHPEN